jgi:hypothetical protein
MTNRDLLVVALLPLALGGPASRNASASFLPAVAQTPSPVSSGWAGSAECRIEIQAPGYSHRETHVWTITGAGKAQGNMEIYPTTWTVSGGGTLQRVSGPTRVTALWNGNGTLQNVEIGLTRHLDRITIQRWTGHGPARSAFTGTETTTVNGASRSRPVALDVQQWTFPASHTGLTSTRITGSTTVPFDGARGPMAPGGVGATGAATCTWDFERGGSSPSAPPSAVAKTPRS